MDLVDIGVSCIPRMLGTLIASRLISTSFISVAGTIEHRHRQCLLPGGGDKDMPLVFQY
jgi:hypothetical protein